MNKCFVLGALFSLFCADSISQTTYLERISIKNQSVEKADDGTVRVMLNLDLNDMGIKKQHAMVIKPFIVSADGDNEVELPSIIVEGKIRHRVNKRVESLTNAKVYPESGYVKKYKKGEMETLSYEASVPFKKWMIGADFVLKADVVGCAQCQEGSEVAYSGGILPPMAPEYVMPFMDPSNENFIRLSEPVIANLKFAVNVKKIDPDFGTNKNELKKLDESIDRLNNNERLALKAVYITGYASPEGSNRYNVRLSQDRALALQSYFSAHYSGISSDNIHVDWKGEDWCGFKKLVLTEHGIVADKKQIIAAVEDCNDNKDICENNLKKILSHEENKAILRNVCPHLRRSEYKIEYQVNPLDIKRARQVMNETPELLSVREIHEVADSYGKGTTQYIECLKRGVQAYPDNVTIINNYSLALMEAGRFNEAIEILSAASADGGLLNLLGVAYMKNGDADKAREAFLKAKAMGDENAEKNISLMQEYIDYISE